MAPLGRDARRRRGPAARDPRAVRGPPRDGVDLRHPDAAQGGRQGPRLVRVREAGAEARLVLPAADPRARGAALDVSPALAKRRTGTLDVQLRRGRRGAVRRARGRGRPGLRPSTWRTRSGAAQPGSPTVRRRRRRAPGRRRSRAASCAIVARSAFVSRRHGRDLDRRRLRLELVRPGAGRPAAGQHDRADPARGPRDERPARDRQQRLGLLLERQRVRVEAAEEADRRRWLGARSGRAPRGPRSGRRPSCPRRRRASSRSPSRWTRRSARLAAGPTSGRARAFDAPGNAARWRSMTVAMPRRRAPGSRCRAMRRGLDERHVAAASGPKPAARGSRRA